MKLFYKEIKKAIFNEDNQIVYFVKRKWSNIFIKNVSNENIATFSRACLPSSTQYMILFNGKEYIGKHSFFNKIVFDKDDIDIVGDSRLFSSHYSCVIRQAQKSVAVIRRERGRIIFEEYEIEIYNPETEKLVIAFLMPAIETLHDVTD